LLVELWAAEHYQRLGDVEAAQRRRDAAKQQATFAETATAASRTLRTQARRAPHHRRRPYASIRQPPVAPRPSVVNALGLLTDVRLVLDADIAVNLDRDAA
jgi:hypothetical protein